jgi:hypothetical protein
MPVQKQCIEMIVDKPRPGITAKERRGLPAYRCTKPVRGDGVLCVLHEMKQERLSRKADKEESKS